MIPHLICQLISVSSRSLAVIINVVHQKSSGLRSNRRIPAILIVGTIVDNLLSSNTITKCLTDISIDVLCENKVLRTLFGLARMLV